MSLIKVAAAATVLAAVTGCTASGPGTSPADSTGTAPTTSTPATPTAGPVALTAIPQSTREQYLTAVPLDPPAEARVSAWRSATERDGDVLRVHRKLLGCDAGSAQFPADANVLDFAEVIEPPIAGTPLIGYQVTVYGSNRDAMAMVSQLTTGPGAGRCTTSGGREVTSFRGGSLELDGKLGFTEQYTFADGSTARARAFAVGVENAVVVGRTFRDATVTAAPGVNSSLEKAIDAIAESLHRSS